MQGFRNSIPIQSPSNESLFGEKFDQSPTIVCNPVGPCPQEFISVSVAAAYAAGHYPGRSAGLNVQGMVADHDSCSQICANGFQRMDEMSRIGFAGQDMVAWKKGGAIVGDVRKDQPDCGFTVPGYDCGLSAFFGQSL